MNTIFQLILNQNRNLIFLDFDKKEITIESTTKEISLKKEEVYKIWIKKNNSKKQKINILIFMLLAPCVFYFVFDFFVFVLLSIIMLSVFSIMLLRVQKYELHIYASIGNFTLYVPKNKIGTVKKIVKEIHKEKNSKRKMVKNDNMND